MTVRLVRTPTGWKTVSSLTPRRWSEVRPDMPVIIATNQIRGMVERMAERDAQRIAALDARLAALQTPRRPRP